MCNVKKLHWKLNKIKGLKVQNQLHYLEKLIQKLNKIQQKFKKYKIHYIN